MLKGLLTISECREARKGFPAFGCLAIAILSLAGGAGIANAAPPGATIANTASLDYTNSIGGTTSVASNTVELTAAVVPSTSSIELTRVLPAGSGTYQETVGPSACFQGAAFINLADPTLSGGLTIDPTQPREVVRSSAYNLGEPIFIRLDDSDQNLDFQLVDVAVVEVTHDASGDTETIRLSETGPNTGIFSGYIPSADGSPLPGDCVLQGSIDTTVRVRYVDPVDANDEAQAIALLDPLSVVFESRTGTVVDGASIALVDATSGLPVPVFGNDGVSTFPNPVVSGSTVNDGSGASYVFGPGQYRFPVVPQGDYRLDVNPPTDYTAPSSSDINDLQLLPGAPYQLGPASFGAQFTHGDPLSFNWDIPVDPASTALFLQKRTLTTIAAPGDFVRYEITLENASVAGVASNVRVVDNLPPGVRYVTGSTVIDGTGAPDPTISADLGTLEFDLGTLGISQRVSISYVVEIIGGRRNDELVNRATAFANNGLISNEASALIRLTEDLFRNSGTIVGRVLEGDCSQDTFGEDAGVPNIRVYLEDGRYAVSDEGGRFHFEGLMPGTHVAQLDTFTVPAWFDVIGCDDAPGYAGRADSQFVKLNRGALLRADFYLRRKPAPEGRIDVELRNRSVDSADKVGYDLIVNGVGNVEISNIDVMILLPDGFKYEGGSMMMDGEPVGDPRVRDQVLSLALPDRIGNWSSKLTFTADIADDVSGEVVSRAVVRFDSPIELGQQTPPAETRMLREPGALENAGYVLDLKFDVLSAELSGEDLTRLDALIRDWQGVSDIRISAVGHSDSTPIAERNRHIYPDNYALSRARANSAAAYMAAELDVDLSSLQVTGRGPDEPVADNSTAEGRRANRRVEMVLSGVRLAKPSFLEVTKASSGTQVADTRGAVPGTETLKRGGETDELPPGMQVEPPLETLEPGVDMLLPEKGYDPAIPATRISIKHRPGQNVAIWVNGTPVSKINFDSMASNGAGTVTVTRWKGVNLRDGNNEIRAVITNTDGTEAKTITRTISYTGLPIRADFVKDASTLVADGKNKPVIAVRLFDRQGNTARPGMIGGYRVDPPYRSWWDVENDRRNELIQIGAREPTYRVGQDGIALIELEPTTDTGEVVVRLKFENNREQDIRAWLTPAERDWILVGFAEGTAAYNTLSDNLVAAADAGLEDGYVDDGRVAFFAKGQVKGEFLLTIAYDSSRERDRSRFDTEVDPNQFYSIYADVSEQRFEAPSQRKLYLKIERNQFVALFGDYDTGLSVTELARYERRFNGIKAEYRNDNFGYSVFAAETDQSFNRDELRGEGTSGLYQLSSAPIIANSEKIRIEVRDRFDTGVVLSSTTLSRFLDYNLDTLAGTLYFKQPVPSRDLDFNPVFIVAEYESISAATDDIVSGGRALVKTADERFEVGMTRIDDRTQGAESDLTGIDMRWRVDDATEVKAEIVESNTVAGGSAQSGSAHKIEVEHNGERLDLKAYLREVEDGFGLGQQSAADQGFRRLGLDARARFNERWSLDGEAGWQQNLSTEDIRNLVRAKLRYDLNVFSASLGLTRAEDKFEDGDRRTSELVDVGLSQKLFKGRLTLRANASTAVNDDAESADFPTRYVFGADYRLTDGVDLVAEWEQAEGRDIDAQMTRIGVRATPWARAQLDTSVTNEVTEFGPRLFANVGLIQGFQLGERWTFDIGADHANTIVQPALRPFDTDRELTAGSFAEDFVSIYTGALYTADLWSANARVEYRHAESEDRSGLLFGWYRKPDKGHGLSAGLTMFRTEGPVSGEMMTTDLKFGWAYRMAERKWSFLNRTDLKFERLAPAGVEEEAWRFINNFNANRRISAAAQLSLQYAFKYVSSDFNGLSVSGYTDLVGVDLRRGFARRWDIGFNTSVYHSYQSDTIDYGSGIDLGLNLASNIWLSVGYNFTGFYDEDFAEARYTAEGPFVRLSVKADQHTLRQIAGQR